MNKCSYHRKQQHSHVKGLLMNYSLYVSEAHCLFGLCNGSSGQLKSWMRTDSFELKDISCVIKHTLRDATVLVLWLHHLNGIIFQVEVDLTLPDPVRLMLCLRHSFLEECFKTQYLQEERGVLSMRFIKLWLIDLFLSCIRNIQMRIQVKHW